MQDIDFDEIDRAVSSVSNTPPTPPNPVFSAPAPISPAAPVTRAPIEDQALAAALAGPEATSPAVRRSTGNRQQIRPLRAIAGKHRQTLDHGNDQASQAVAICFGG